MSYNTNLRRLLLPASLILALVFTSCQKDDLQIETALTPTADKQKAEVALRWNEVYLNVERFSSGYRPPVSARALGYLSLAAYEAAVPGMPQHRSLASRYPGLKLPKPEAGAEYHWPTCVNEAYYTLMPLFFPHAPNAQRIEMTRLAFEFKNRYATLLAGNSDIYQRSQSFGKAVAEAVYAWSVTDRAGHEAFLRNHDPAYLPNAGNQPGLWKPTPPEYTPALLPNWGAVRPFVLKENELLCPPPLPFSSETGSPFYAQAMEVYQITKQLKKEDKWIAIFWSDDVAGLTFTPAARWVAVANQVVALEEPSLATSLELYAKMGMALADSGISCWHSKYSYNLERPISYINRVIDDRWKTPLAVTTPPFPAYPSGHSTFGGAAAVVLNDIFGTNYSMIDRCHENRTDFDGTPRAFSSFDKMAEENAYSRIPLGVHFRIDCEEGLRLGREIGGKVVAMPWKK